MPFYFFDITDERGAKRDDVGVECVSLDRVRSEAMRALPDIAREHMPQNGDRHLFTVLVRDEAGRAVYTATLGFAGMWLTDR